MSAIFAKIRLHTKTKPQKSLTYYLGRKLLYTVAIIALILSPFSGAAKVRASSVYDSAVRTTNTLLVKHPILGTYDITNKLFAIMAQQCPMAVIDSFTAAVNGGGSWSVSQFEYTYYAATTDNVLVYWTSNTSEQVTLSASDAKVPVTGMATISGGSPSAVACTGQASMSESRAISAIPSTGCLIDPDCDVSTTVFLSTYDVTYPSGYEGLAIPSTNNTDNDNDGLTVTQEHLQGTSDNAVDTDGDGLDDYAESMFNDDRYSIFCDTPVSIYVCAYPNPSDMDVYVEIDWLDDGVDSYEPSSTQLGLVKDKFSEVGIKFHADTGQYGGGNAINSSEAPTDLTTDFYDHKYGSISESANFDAATRYRIWHYMISGYNFDDGTTGSQTSSGKAEGGGDDTFIAYGYIKDNQSGFGYSSLNDAIAGTIVHELGHNLCLTNHSYTGQNPLCLFSGVDDEFNANNNYHSAMNYTYQFTNQYSYSDGTNGTGDHNDAGAILFGIDDFLNDDDGYGF